MTNAELHKTVDRSNFGRNTKIGFVLHLRAGLSERECFRALHVARAKRLSVEIEGIRTECRISFGIKITALIVAFEDVRVLVGPDGTAQLFPRRGKETAAYRVVWER